MTSGIYFIINNENGRHYVGSSQDVELRLRTHLNLLKRGAHHSYKLRIDWKRFSDEAFSFDLIEKVEMGQLAKREQYWIDETLPYYNVLRFAGNVRGMRHTDEAKRKMSNAKRGRKMSSIQREAISAKLRGRKLSESHIAALKGREHSTETRKKLSEAHTGRTLSLEHLDGIRRANSKRVGVTLTKSHLEKMRIAKENMSDVSKEIVRLANVKTHAKSYIVTDPNGLTYDVFNLSEFSRMHNLGAGAGLNRVASGLRKHHRGWTCSPKQQSEI